MWVGENSHPWCSKWFIVKCLRKTATSEAAGPDRETAVPGCESDAPDRETAVPGDDAMAPWPD